MNDTAIRGALLVASAFIGYQLATSGSGSDPDDGGFKPRFLDRRKYARLSTKAAPHTRMRNANEVVTGVVLHQMGFSRGSDPSKYDAVTAHYKILPDGTIVWSHDHRVRLPAANKFNGYTISVEFAGNLPSVEGSRDPRHYWSPETHGMNNLTNAQKMSGRWLMRHLNKRYGIRYVFGHVQSEAGKGNDPGPAIWRNVAMYAKTALGMSSGGPGYYIDGGKAIPSSWEAVLA